MTELERQNMRRAATDAMDYWPNAHLGDCTRREDLKSAFLFVRTRIERGTSLSSAIGQLESDVDRYVDM